MDLSRNLKKLFRNMEDHGVSFAIKRGFMYLLVPFYKNQTFRIYRIKINGTVPDHIRETSFQFKLLSPEDKDFISQVESISEWLKEKLKSRLIDGDLCLVALDGSKIAGYNLVALKYFFISWIDHEIMVKPHEAWSEQITVQKDYRKRGLASELRNRMFIELKKQGIKKFYGGTLPSNEAALKLTRKVGFQEIADIHYLKIFMFKRWKYDRIKKGL
jgi:ribosomal protein S18 acetylase RimI-like enzyme